MNMKVGITAVAMAFGLSLSQPAQANDILNYVQNYFGGVNNNVNYAEAERMTQLDDDRAEVDGRISAALSAGRITPAQAGDLHAQLRSNRGLEIQLVRDGRFSFSDAQTVANALSAINVRLQNAMSTNIVINPRPGFGFPPRGFVARKQVNDLQNQIATRMQRGLSDGRLTNEEFSMLRRELSSIELRERQMRTSQGFLSFQEHQRLISRLNRLQDQMRVEMNDSQIAGRPHYPWY